MIIHLCLALLVHHFMAFFVSMIIHLCLALLVHHFMAFFFLVGATSLLDIGNALVLVDDLINEVAVTMITCFVHLIRRIVVLIYWMIFLLACCITQRFHRTITVYITSMISFLLSIMILITCIAIITLRMIILISNNMSTNQCRENK